MNVGPVLFFDHQAHIHEEKRMTFS